MTRFLLSSLFALSAFAADSDFNGRWNIRVQAPRGRVWWLEVSGAGSGKIAGSFVGAPGGQVDPLSDARIENGQLVFSFNRPKLTHTFRASVKNGQLTGTREVIAGGQSSSLPWTGIRAPELAERDDASWRPGRTISLFDGKTTAGWRQIVPELPGWHVESGLLKNKPKASDIASLQKFWNFEARIEYRYAKGSNSGLGLRGRYEVQIHDNFGKPPDTHGNGALYSRIPPSVNASRAPGEWQTLAVRLVGRDLTVILNGTTIINRQQVVGPTAITTDPEEDQPGPFVLQGDHGPIEFRSIQVTELVRK
jgi:hypothetical protein